MKPSDGFMKCGPIDRPKRGKGVVVDWQMVVRVSLAEIKSPAQGAEGETSGTRMGLGPVVCKLVC